MDASKLNTQGLDSYQRQSNLKHNHQKRNCRGQSRACAKKMKLLITTAIASLTTIACSNGLQNYTQITLQAAPLGEGTEVTAESLERAESVLEERLSELGVELAEVDVAEPDTLIVKLPQTENVQSAQSVLTNTGQLHLRNQKAETEEDLARNIEALQRLLIEQNTLAQQRKTEEADALQKQIDQARAEIADLFEPSDLTGDMLHDARARPSDTAVGTWDINIQFNEEGSALFAEQTKQMAGTGRTIGLFLDDVLLSTPEVDVSYAQGGIKGGTAVISGNFTRAAAEDLEAQLKSGALPVSLKPIEVTSSGDAVTVETQAPSQAPSQTPQSQTSD